MNRRLPARLPYEQTRTFPATLRGGEVDVVSKPGFPNWDRTSPSSDLLAEVVALPPDADVLLIGCGRGALAVALGRLLTAGSITLMDDNVVALSMARRTADANGLPEARVSFHHTLLPGHEASFDVAILEAPRDRKLARRWLVEAHATLKPNGSLYVAGANNQGIRPILDDAAALFGNATLLATRMRSRAALAQKSSDCADAPEWARTPGIAPGTWHELVVEAGGHRLRLHTLPGVFSHDRLDDGTRLLLAHLDVPRGARVLDVGCGSGVIGLVAALSGAAWVDMLDANLLAVASAAESITLNSIPNARALPSDALSAVEGERYDLIVTNPPFHLGAGVDYQVAQAFVDQASRALVPGGTLLLVANRFIRYERIASAALSGAEVVADDGRYRLLSSTFTGGSRSTPASRSGREPGARPRPARRR